MRVRQFLPVLIALILTAGCASEEPALPEQPNILFIFSDDHSRHAISAYGSVINRTPNIDRIADEGLLFTHCLVTNSICAPSRATVLTGKYSHLNGQLTNGERFDGTQMTFPKLLQEAGYQTAVIGKWHLKSEPTGFDYWRVLIGQGPYYNPPIGSPEDTVVVNGYTSEVVTDLALDWLEEGRDSGRPFMMMYQHKAPHRNWQPGPDRIGDYDDVDVPMPPTFYDDYSNRTRAAEESIMRIADNLNAYDLKISDQTGRFDSVQTAQWESVYGPRNERVREARMDEEKLVRWKYQRYVKDYLRSVQSMDDAIGRVLDYLDESGLAENTIVIYNSDQGWYLGEHGWYDKRWIYEPSLRTPLMVRWPGVIPEGSVSDAMVSNLDFAPTFLDLADVARPTEMQGASLVPILASAQPGPGPVRADLELVEARDYGAEVPFFETPADPMATFQTPSGWRGSFYYHYYEYPGWHCVRRHYGVRTDRYKLVYFYTLDEWELFDLESDPDELNSVADDPAYSTIRAELQAELTRLRDQYEVPEDTRPDGEAECTLGGVGWPGYDA